MDTVNNILDIKETYELLKSLDFIFYLNSVTQRKQIHLDPLVDSDLHLTFRDDNKDRAIVFKDFIIVNDHTLRVRNEIIGGEWSHVLMYAELPYPQTNGYRYTISDDLPACLKTPGITRLVKALKLEKKVVNVDMSWSLSVKEIKDLLQPEALVSKTFDFDEVFKINHDYFSKLQAVFHGTDISKEEFKLVLGRLINLRNVFATGETVRISRSFLEVCTITQFVIKGDTGVFSFEIITDLVDY